MTKLKVGLGQASRLAQMSNSRRLEFIAEGLPIILQSSRGFLQSSKALKEHQREADVLESYAEEESAKALILLDMVRCPPKQISSNIGKMTGWFYKHLARMIYAAACRWKPMHVVQLQEYANRDRKLHYLDGDHGEYIFPNDHLFSRESKLYADVIAYEDDKLEWNVPTGFKHFRFKSDPTSCRVVESLAAVGAFSDEGLAIIAEVWGRTNFEGIIGYAEDRQLKQKMLELLIEKRLPLEHATDKDVSSIYDGWQFPMYNLDLAEIPVSIGELNAERDMLAAREW